jgi:prevent-host-death family protein
MRIISLAEAKAHLSAVLDDVATGQQVVITRRGRPVARIVPEPVARKRAASAWVEELRGFVEAQPKAAGSAVVELRDREPY